MKRFFATVCALAIAFAAHSQDISVGIISSLYGDAEAAFARLKEIGVKSCQTGFALEWDNDTAKEFKRLKKRYGVEISALVYCTPNGRWNFMEGPATIGLVPPINRIKYLDTYKKAVDFCAAADIPAMHSHFGFIPEEPTSELYTSFIATMRDLCQYAKDKGVMIYCETGQETPTTLIRAIHDIGTGNIFVNCDTAHLILYGKAHPVDAIYQFGPLLKELHAKDGFYPTDPYYLGHEAKIPEGKVNFPAVVKALKDIGFKGVMTIECELGGDNTDYILKTKEYLEDLIRDTK